MMKTLGLVLALLFVVAGASMAADATIDVYAGANLVSVSRVPLNPAPSAVFGSIPIDYSVARWDAINNGYITYDPDNQADFGGVLLGDAYWVNADGTYHSSFAAVADGVPDATGKMTDMWISLPGWKEADGNKDAGGYHLFGQPFEHPTAIDKGTGTGDHIFFTDGSTLKTWGQATDGGWVNSVMAFWDQANNGYLYVWFDGSGDDTMLRPGNGYWINTFKDDLAMIIPAD